MLPEDCQANIDVQAARFRSAPRREACAGGRPRHCAYEVAAPGQAFRLHGVDEVRCKLQLPDSFRFTDGGWTTAARVESKSLRAKPSGGGVSHLAQAGSCRSGPIHVFWGHA